ncbi:hypothetical protein [Paenibacillus turpanensis]|uniref:hypothetical protein n=1 Tax=Paenibacillus turpanensis TaxID=2689078 RepID=UPI00140BD363|nr:hypothetical protein [Paenibacillus turpanensis]
MKDTKSKASLQLFLVTSLILTLTSSIQVFVNILQERPYWLVTLLLFPIPFFIFSAIMISLDLAKQDYTTLQGRVITKGKDIIVVRIEHGKDKKFRVKNDLINDLVEETDIEIQYYKRTKAVISIKKINQRTTELSETEG